jgi:hypothetical protein
MSPLAIIVAAVAVSGLAGCFATQTLRFSESDLIVSATRTGCNITDFSVENHGNAPRQAYGEIDVLDENKNTQVTFSYHCGVAYPGGKSLCRSYLSPSSPSKKLPPTGGVGCPGYSTFHNRLKSYSAGSR